MSFLFIIFTAEILDTLPKKDVSLHENDTDDYGYFGINIETKDSSMAESILPGIDFEKEKQKSFKIVNVNDFENAPTGEDIDISPEAKKTTLKCIYCEIFSSDDLETIYDHCRSCPKEAATSVFRKFVCIVCSYVTNQSGNMKKHLRIHLDEKCYFCSFCSYKSTHSNALENHLRNHTGEKPFKCELCSFRSSSHAGISYHKKTVLHSLKSKK